MTKEDYIEFKCPMKYVPHPELREIWNGLDTGPNPMEFRKAGKVYKYFEAFEKLITIEKYKKEIEELQSEGLLLESIGERIRVRRLIADYNRFMKKNFNNSKTDESL